MKIIPYRFRTTREDNSVYDFNFKPTKQINLRHYEVEITLHFETNEIVNKTCECPDFIYRKSLEGKECKHITEACRILKEELII